MTAAVLAGLGVCLQLAAAPQVPAQFIPTTQFTLAWTHTIEKVRWEEDYRVLISPQGQAVLHATQARIKGAAAGMEPPNDARWHNGWYVYSPTESHPQQLPLMRSVYSADYEWCEHGRCVPMSAKMPSDGDLTLLQACTAPAEF